LSGTVPRIAFGGYVSLATGFGTAARSYVHALHGAGIPMTVLNRSAAPRFPVKDPLVESLLDRPIDAQLGILHVEPISVPAMQSIYSHLIVLTAWETDRLPSAYVETLNQVLEVWVPSRYNAETFRAQIDTPVFQLPHPIHVSQALPNDRQALDKGLALKDSDFVFVCVATWQERKNLPGLIEAFLRAFPENPNVLLVIKTGFHLVHQNVACVQIADAIQRAGATNSRAAEERIRICDGFWPEEKIAALMERADCYASLHRGEGWCYPLFDAAGRGTPVVATAYSGPLDYLDPRYHHLVKYELTSPTLTEHFENYPFSGQMQWAEPDLEDAAQHMRSVHEDREGSRQRARTGAELLQQRFSQAAVGESAKQRLIELAIRVGC
jgi:glycosyltransferase involved in cell wall biosynthesis